MPDECNKCVYKSIPKGGSFCYMFNERPPVCKNFQAVKLIGPDGFDYPLQLMTYEQFLKQLRRIGRHIMLSSIIVALSIAFLATVYDIPIVESNLIDILVLCCFLFLAGFAIYPIKGEE